MKLFNFKLKYLLYLLILFNILLALRWLFDGNLFFHTDIARDFLLLEDIVDNKNLTLIGPRSGAIPGLFHGPLWLYLNLPAFFIGSGDPLYVGWFWALLYILSLFIIYYVAKKMFGEEEGILSALLLSSITMLQVRALFNPYGALILSPLFFYLLINYLQTRKVKVLILALFILGLIIQFQMAFGIPILILVFLYLVYFSIKIRKYWHLVSFLTLLLPLSTHILFEFRNQFLQLKSVMNYLWGTQGHGKLSLNFIQLLSLRTKEFILDGLGTITQSQAWLTLGFLLLVIYALYRLYQPNNNHLKKYRLFFFLIIYFYTGFWFFTTFFKGPVWGYYYMPFIPMIILIFILIKQVVNRVIFYIFFLLIYLSNISAGFQDMAAYNPDILNQDVSTWKFNKVIAEKVFSGPESTLGYFIFTPDLYGYSPRYALDYYQKRAKQKTVQPYGKEEVTYLVVAPPPEYGRDPNSIWYQKNTNSATWKSNDIRIYRKPDDTFLFNNGFIIEKYILTDKEKAVKPNPFLINGIFFR